MKSKLQSPSQVTESPLCLPCPFLPQSFTRGHGFASNGLAVNDLSYIQWGRSV